MTPNGRIPTLEEDGFFLWESPAILKYLSAKHSDRGLCGVDAKTQALVDQWICWWVGGPEAAMDALAWEMLIKPKVLNQPGNDPGIMSDAVRGSPASCPCSTSSSMAATTFSARSLLSTSSSAHASILRPQSSIST